MLGLYRKLSTRAPLGVAFATCFVKGSASDAVSQQVVEQRPALDVQRNTAFAFFSGAYLGCGQHFVYNVAFTRVFGSGRSAGVALCKVLADAIVHVPCVYLPLYYAFETPALIALTPEQSEAELTTDSASASETEPRRPPQTTTAASLAETP